MTEPDTRDLDRAALVEVQMADPRVARAVWRLVRSVTLTGTVVGFIAGLAAGLVVAVLT